MSHHHRGLVRIVARTCGVILIAASAGAQASIVDTKHNLSTSGPGPFRSTTESRICIFCHTPHRARVEAPLWNREDSTQSYLVYDSTTFQGIAGQPNGSSKLCLSCHDGSIALGAVVSMSAEIPMEAGHRFLDTGPAYLGTNLADDHPISFDYDASAGGSSPEYLDSHAIVPPVHLDADGRLQCTSCHDPHDNTFGKFLLTSERFSALCTSCHQPTGWSQTSHSTSFAVWDGAGTDPWPTAAYATVAENACRNCHTPHNAQQAERLLEDSPEEDTCLKCHNGHVAQESILADLSKPYRHDVYAFTGVHDPIEDPLTMTRHVECQDCHDPHEAKPGSAAPPGVPGPLTGASGVNTSGVFVTRASAGYEVCYKCHADNNSGNAHIPRLHQQTNVRLEFDPGNPSYHPIEAPGANPSVPSLIGGLTESSLISCTDCHSSEDAPNFGGNGPAGPHGSSWPVLLGARLEMQDGLQESSAIYALCYRCHSRSSILSNDSFKEHKKHVQNEKISCTSCHDPHGVSASQGTFTNNTHLINFDLRVVSPNPQNGILEFVDQGFRHGSCTLMCHGERHNNEHY